MSEEKQNEHYQIVRGLPCPVSARFTRKNLEDAMDLVPGEGDLVIASYPKTGTTWVTYIILQIKSGAENFPSFEDSSSKFVPYVELVGVDAVLAQDKPRFYKHHIAYNYVQKNDKSKCVYTYRHPEDTVVSYYNFALSVIPGFAPEFDAFFNHFVSGNIAYGNYFQHVLSFYEHHHDDNLLMVSYEKLHAKGREEILRIAKFLGEEYHGRLLEDEGVLDKIIEHTSFDYMKKNLHFAKTGGDSGSQSGGNSEANFFRKGIVGDGKTVLTELQRQRLKEAAEKILKGTSIMDEWYSK